MVKNAEDLRIKEINCLCGHDQEVTERNLYQDLDGMFTVCDECRTFHCVE